MTPETISSTLDVNVGGALGPVSVSGGGSTNLLNGEKADKVTAGIGGKVAAGIGFEAFVGIEATKKREDE